MLNITEVRVNIPRDTEGKVKAYADIVIDGCFKVRGIVVINGNDGHYTSMPNRKKKDGTRVDIAHPLNEETRQQIENLVIDEYEAELNRRAGVTSLD